LCTITTGSTVTPSVPLGSAPVASENTPEKIIEKRTMLGERLIEVGHVRVLVSGKLPLRS